MRMVAAFLLAVQLVAVASQQSIPGATPEEMRTYGAFRTWITSQPAAVQQASDDVVYERYGAELRRQGRTDPAIAATIASIKKIGDRAEIEMWNRVLTSANPRFTTAPNAFLVAMTRDLKPGRSLDVGMGQGRNTIYLAQQG